jgi:hypothetical protein
MLDFTLENLKLVILFMLIGTIIVLSHLNVENLAKMKSALMGHKTRGIGRNAKATVQAN